MNALERIKANLEENNILFDVHGSGAELGKEAVLAANRAYIHAHKTLRAGLNLEKKLLVNLQSFHTVMPMKF
jgi:hypothetical protein